METVNEDFYMARCLQLAKQGMGYVAPNPMVGAVIVHENKIIGEGLHRNFGGPHAEVEAINSVIDKSLLENSTLYVNLEPCNHHGKTPPCTELIIKNKIPKVAIGMRDPFSKVNGMGIRKLEDAGVNVVCGILEEECKELNKRFILFQESKRPYIILKWAQSIDGFIGKAGERIQISNELSSVITHKWRSEEKAILIGSNTAKIDNPQLNVRDWSGPSPIRIIINTKEELPSALNIFNGLQRTIIFSHKQNRNYLNTENIFIDPNVDFIPSLLHQLYQLNIQSVIVEGGAKTLNSFINSGYWDEARIFESDILLKDGILSPNLPGLPDSIENIGDNRLYNFVNRKKS